MGARRRTEHGAAAVMVAMITTFVLFAVAALTVDIGNTWARRGSLQFQVDRAAKFAAEKLPVDSTVVPATPTASQLAVANAAATYLACHPVSGQTAVVTLPSCANTAGITTLASTLLSNGKSATPTAAGSLRFPANNKVSLVGPQAKISFGFGTAAGKRSSNQSKQAIAVALSPGNLLPVGMSLTCMAAAAGSAPLGIGDTISTVMPINYVSTGYPSAVGSAPVTPTPTPAMWDDIVQSNAYPASITINPSSYISASGSVHLDFGYTVGKTGWTLLSITVYIRKEGWVTGDPTYTKVVDIPLLQQGAVSGTTSVDLQLPAGRYAALVGMSGRNGGMGHLLDPPTKWFNNPNQNAGFTVPDSGQLRSLVSCARPIQSPRNGFANGTDAGDRAAMPVNIAQGLDHGLAAFPGLADAVDGLALTSATTVPGLTSLLANPSSAFGCVSNASVKLDYSTWRTDEPNCMHVDTSRDWATELTQGLLTGGTFNGATISGRLRCPASGSCNFSSSRPVLNNPGGISGTYNDDHFSDFILKAANGSNRYLSDPFFFSLQTFLSGSLPLVTPPNDTVDPSLYSSPRFFWSPVLTTAFTTGAANDYPTMTFRPVFLTSDSSSQITTPIDTLLLGLVNQATSLGLSLVSTLTAFGQSAVCLLLPNACELAMLKLSDISSALNSYLGSGTVTVGGLVIDKNAQKVREARIMPLAPDAMPAVPSTYNGPTTDYLGVGPKIIRLVR